MKLAILLHLAVLANRVMLKLVQEQESPTTIDVLEPLFQSYFQCELSQQSFKFRNQNPIWNAHQSG